MSLIIFQMSNFGHRQYITCKFISHSINIGYKTFSLTTHNTRLCYMSFTPPNTVQGLSIQAHTKSNSCLHEVFFFTTQYPISGNFLDDLILGFFATSFKSQITELHVLHKIISCINFYKNFINCEK